MHHRFEGEDGKCESAAGNGSSTHFRTNGPCPKTFSHEFTRNTTNGFSTSGHTGNPGEKRMHKEPKPVYPQILRRAQDKLRTGSGEEARTGRIVVGCLQVMF